MKKETKISMGIISKPLQDSTINSPNSNNGSGTSPPLTPRSEVANNPYPTTFVQADTSSFKQVVQMLTGSSDAAKNPSSSSAAAAKGFPIPPNKTPPKKQGFKLYERRNSLKNGLIISPLNSGSFLKPEVLSPSILDFPALVLSPVTPLTADPFDKSSSSEEEKAIAEKKFYFHPSPRTDTPRDSQPPPQLLPLFPVTSPRVSDTSSSSS
ncbi:PREDICTED: VQ motif-containing protein 4-like [Ipomoea nil]|uniref:VQ motif-containing protein 4-like n=1 Tax=Ipomoea nil TaxID=35883 RepID=UPI000900FD31|nr:PREDICTED: VQ motif-containing protein 4-like [Ipomoea nil]